MRRRSAPPERDADLPGVEFGWRVHDALQDWTKSADQKASIILAFSVALATIAGNEVLNRDGGLHDASGVKFWLVRAMAAAFAVSAVFAISVVLPRLRRHAQRRDTRGLVYFGELRHRNAVDIERHLRALDDDETLKQLARQLEVTSAIAWRKHAHLQIAIVWLLVASVLFAIARLAL